MKEEIVSVVKELLNQPEIRDTLSSIVLEAALHALSITKVQEDANKLISTNEACAMLSISRQTLGKWVNANKVTKKKVPGSNSSYYQLTEIKSLLKDYSYGKKEAGQ
jgi:predicted DNA-binding transcriptional regulator AlpA